MSTVYSRFFSFLKRFVGGILFQGVTFIVAIALIGGVYAGWASLNRDDAATGKPVTQTMMQGIIDNLNDLNQRILGNAVAEGGSCARVGSISTSNNGVVLSCQSGTWKTQPTPVAYTDKFDYTGFTSGRNLCSQDNQPQREYTLNLTKKSLVLMSTISGIMGGGGFTGIGYNGALCGYDAGTTGYYGTTSANCSFILYPGLHKFNFCVRGGTDYVKGSVVILHVE